MDQHVIDYLNNQVNDVFNVLHTVMDMLCENRVLVYDSEGNERDFTVNDFQEIQGVVHRRTWDKGFPMEHQERASFL